MAKNLPETLIFHEILSRLAVKFLIRFTLVSKRWLFLITNPGPIQSHLALTSLNLHNSNSFVVNTFHEYRTEITVFHGKAGSIDNSNIKICNNIFGFGSSSDRKPYVALLGSVNGLICFSHSNAHQVFVIWNPVTNLFKAVSKPSRAPSGMFVHEKSGFCYYPVYVEFKILHVECYEVRELKKKRQLLRVQVYSCNRDTWKEIKDERLPHVGRFRVLGNFKGKVYLKFSASVNVLVAFDVHREVFKVLPCTESSIRGNIKYGDLNWMDCLGVVVEKRETKERAVYALDDVSGSWFQEYILPDSVKRNWLLFRLNNGDLVVDFWGKLFLFEFESNVLKNYVDLGLTGLFEVFTYTESLVFIKGMQRIEKENNKNMGSGSIL